VALVLHKSWDLHKTALNVGPQLHDGLFFADTVWSAANYWKHEGEWWEDVISFGTNTAEGLAEVKIAPPNAGKQSQVSEGRFGKFGRDYICSNVLCELGNGLEFSLLSLMPDLKRWRRSVVD
jgi:hypothetical protein